MLKFLLLVIVNGGWSSWGDWGPCSGQECSEEGMVRFRSRTCTSPAPQDGGDFCSGSSFQKETCPRSADCSGIK